VLCKFRVSRHTPTSIDVDPQPIYVFLRLSWKIGYALILGNFATRSEEDALLFSYISFTMADDHRISITSSSSDLQSEGSEYTYHTDSSNEHPSLPQAVERKCVCKLSVKFLLEHRRFVNNSQNSHVGVGYWNSFQDQVDNDYFPFSLGGKCVDVGGGENWEFWVEYYDMQCLACGNMTEFNMYQDILRFEKGVDGCMRAKLVSVQFMLSIFHS